MNHDVIVIGGGVSGLATARDLMARGLDVLVLERQVVAGGNAISERFDGFLMEHGPSTFNASVPGGMDHLATLGLLDSAHGLGPEVRRRYLRDGDRLTGVSTHPLGFILSNYLSLPARASMLLEALRPRRRARGEETIHAFASRRFGREFADKVIDPMAAGLFMGDARALSLAGAFARLAEMEQTHGSITRAILKAHKGSEPGRRLYSWPGGIGTIPQALALALGDRVRTGVSVLKLRRAGAGFEVHTSTGTPRARAVVLAVQPHVAAGLLAPLDPEGADAAGAITAPPVNVVFLGYRRDRIAHRLDGLGFLATRDSARIISGAQFCSTMYAGRAPAGHVAISAYSGGARNPDLGRMPDADLVAQTHAELAGLLGIKGPPMLHRTRRWPLGLPQYTLGHQARATVLAEASRRQPGLFVTGNFLHGVSVANCLSAATQTAAAVARALSPSASADQARLARDPSGLRTG